MKIKLLLLFCLSGNALYCQEDLLKVFAENGPGGIVVFASNDAFCPMSLDVNLKLENLEVVGDKQPIYVVPEKNSKYKLLELKVKNPKKKSSYSFGLKYNFGNALQQTFETDYAYDLPYRKGQKFTVFQGYNGKLSHVNTKALDFSMPEGTDILAARDGVVIKLEQSHTESCSEEKCKEYNNYVIVYHSDGTFAEYTHIIKNGARVKVGDKVKKGDLVAISGKVGWATGPHLHFVCFLGGIETRNTIPTLFKVEDGKSIGTLQEGKSYTRNY